MLKMRRMLGLSAVVVLLVSGCGGGGGDSDSLSTDACGAIGLSSKIVQGTACSGLNRSPIVRVLLVDSGGTESFCTGSMLTAQTVLTAAHCIVIAHPARVFVVYGEPLASASFMEARTWQIHPDFGSQGASFNADVALLHLQQPLALPTLPVLTSRAVREGDVVSIFGYGQDENGDFDFDDLKSGEMRVSEAAPRYIRADYEGEGSDTCLGDSGGPLIEEVDGLPALAGVTSSGTSATCAVGDNSYFSNLQDPVVLQFLQIEVPGLQTR